MKFLRSVIFLISSAAICFLTWLIFRLVTPYVIGLAWYWILLIAIVCGGFLVPLFAFLPGLLSYSINKLKSHSQSENIIVSLITLIFCIMAIILPWTFPVKNLVGGIVLDLLALGVFWGVYLTFISDNSR